ncbi:hypothetical protein C8J57DRAFT_1293136 [Mycena rebaudengoi]|nr:hypothetical protein C8J57DRAFT_1293136 [Mycena rebaudengoi]
MDRILAPKSAEALATQFIENASDWDVSGTNIDESLIASYASYLSGEHLFILPRTRSELESVLRRYSYDAIHNALSFSRTTLVAGGYSRVCDLAINSIEQVLNTGDNVPYLLSLHVQKDSAAREEGGQPRSAVTT